jgi:polysaccharide deacetylase family protein (PEP-CTERM system associated)
VTAAGGVRQASLTVDVEDWFHPELVYARVSRDDPRTVVEEGTDALLELLRRHGARGTFFVLGNVAARHPALVRRIADAGHEIACHGTTHRPLWTLDPASFRAELREFRAAIRTALGADDAIGFRAPTFSLDSRTAWALEVLAEEGFRYDSSIFPRRVRLYGVDRAPLGIYRPSPRDLTRHDPGAPMVELPVAVDAVAGIRIPAAGGFYLRALPRPLIETLLARVHAQRPCVLYVHPWECAASVPRLRLPWADALITYHRLEAVLPRLERLLARFGSRPMREILEQGGHLRPAAA